ncbi:MAG: phosphoglycerate dehydrogenase [Xenococcaceae cyanobacterium]
MVTILITHPIDRNTIQKLNLEPVNFDSSPNRRLFLISEEVFYRNNGKEEIIYIPSISLKQLPDERYDPSLKVLCQALSNTKPDVLIVGNNAVPDRAIATWRRSVGYDRRLLIIRRGVDTRAIDKVAAEKYRVSVDNLPGINSPYVAKHMSQYLKLNEAKPGCKLAVLGVGNIGKHIAIEGIERGLEVRLFSPSLQNPQKRKRILWQRGIASDKVICAESIDRLLAGATHVAISVPCENCDGSTNADMLNACHIKSLAPNANIVSASVPRVFDEGAIALMNERVRLEKMLVRIDTSKRRADEVIQNYPCLDIAHDIAFAASECQQELDNAMLEKARKFVQTPLQNWFQDWLLVG